ncbi:MAG TPA: glycerol-3-phosphate 1-O-acyltransferase PlsY [Bacillota bacterium]
METLKVIAAIIISFLIGSILTGDIVAYLKKVNVRAQGSGNIGATNVYRSLGAFYGALVLAGDTLKGIIAVLIGGLLGNAYGLDLAVVAGIMSIAGHNWSVFAGFKGGKGISTSFGVAIGLTPLTLIILVPIWLVLFLLTRYVSLASITAVIVYPLTVFLLYSGDLQKLIFAILLAILAVYRHQANIGRLVHGEENKISFRKRKDAEKG